MSDRQDRLDLLGTTYMAVIVISYFTGVNTTACTDQTGLDKLFHVKQMCMNGTLRNVRLVIDTWDTGDPDIHSCTCTVTLDTGSAPSTASTTVTVQEYPGIEPLSPCGSKLSITSTTSSSFTETGCIPIPANPINNFGRYDMLTLTLSRTHASTEWRSGHCILISQDDFTYELIVTCQSTQGIQTTIPTTTEDIATTTVKSRETTTTTQSTETTTATQTREITTYNFTNSGSTTLEKEKCVQQPHPQQGCPLTTLCVCRGLSIDLCLASYTNNLKARVYVGDCKMTYKFLLIIILSNREKASPQESAVVVPLVVTTLLITVSVVAHVILYRRRLALVKQPEYTNAVMTSPRSVNYDSLELFHVAPPNIYADTSTV